MNQPRIPYRVRFETRLENPGWLGIVSSILGVVLALIIGGFVLKIAGATSPVSTYQAIFQQGFGTFADSRAATPGAAESRNGPPTEESVLASRTQAFFLKV